MTEFQPGKLLESLCASGVEFVLIGGFAAAVHGLARATYDLDIVYRHSIENCRALAGGLAPFKPYLRDVPPGLPFSLDHETLMSGANFILTTTVGDIDLFAEVPGSSGYEELTAHAQFLEAFNCRFLCVALDKLIDLKRAAGRPRDFDMIAQLETLRKAKLRDELL